MSSFKKESAVLSSDLEMNPLESWSKTSKAALRSFSSSESVCLEEIGDNDGDDDGNVLLRESSEEDLALEQEVVVVVVVFDADDDDDMGWHEEDDEDEFEDWEDEESDCCLSLRFASERTRDSLLTPVAAQLIHDMNSDSSIWSFSVCVCVSREKEKIVTRDFVTHSVEIVSL